MSTEKISTRMSGNVQIIQYDNPPRGYLTGGGCALLASAVQAAIDDDAVQVLVLTGSKDVFIRHYDVSELLKAGELLRLGKIDETAFENPVFAQMTNLISASPKPVIAAINGICMGGGFELALACDIRIASDSVQQIGLPEMRLNIFPGGGGTQRLPRLIGEAAALNFILRAMVVEAKEAQEIGLVHEISEDALARAEEIAAELVQKSSESLAAVKKLVRSAASHDMEEGLLVEQRNFTKILGNDDAILAMKAFCESDDQDILK